MINEPLRLADAPDVLTPVEVARVLRVDRNTVYDMLNAKTIRSRKSGRRYLVPKSAIIEYLSAAEGHAS